MRRDRGNIGQGLAERTAFANAYRDHSARVRASAMRVLKDSGRAEDVAQEVFERLWRNPDRYDPRRGDLGPYLQLVARSRALDAWRAEGAATRATDRLGTLSVRDHSPDDDQPGVVAERRDTAQRLLAAVRRLPPTQREAVLLAHWGGMSSSEIAQRMGVPLGTAKSRLRLAHEKLREEWAESEAIPTSTAVTGAGP
ncbi:MAG: RNA polymerase sigma factor [Solirubrobacteraceae bacterium]